jgi:2'-5' RNA ligase
VAVAGIHLTLKFLGEVAAEQLEAVSASLGAVAAATPPIALGARGLGVFPTLTRPRVVWAGVPGGAGALAALAGRIDAAMAPLGFAPEARPFRGHLTLGRVRSPGGTRPLTAQVVAGGQAVFGDWTVRELQLYRSHLRPSGAVYEVLAAWPLAAAAP